MRCDQTILNWAMTFLNIKKQGFERGIGSIPPPQSADGQICSKIMMLVVKMKYCIWHGWEIAQVVWISAFITTRYLDQSCTYIN